MDSHNEQQLNRRSVLKIGASGLAAGLSGCITFSGRGEQSPPTPTSTDRPTPTETSTPTETPRFPESGTIKPVLNGEEPWPDQFFQGDVELEIDHTAEELRERYHWNQYETIADSKESDLLREFPHKLTDPEWVEENIYERAEEEYDAEVDDIFDAEKYVGEGPLDQRYTESGYNLLYRLVEHLTMPGGVSSGFNYIRAAELAAAEHYTAGNDTIVTEHQTTNVVHGLCLAIENPTYNPEEAENQEIWGIETDPNEDKPIWDLDETESYPNDSERHPVETREPDIHRAWAGIGLGTGTITEEGVQNEQANLDIQLEGVSQFEDFLRTPDEELGMKYLDSICLAGHLYNEAHEGGDFPEFAGSTVTVEPGQIGYELA